MGRHSAPEDDFAESFEGAAVVATAPTAIRGRHARSDDDAPGPTAFDDTANISYVDLVDATGAQPGQPSVDQLPFDQLPLDQLPVDQPAPKPRKRAPEHSTAADFALVREHRDVRARVIAAILVPFVIYTGAMAATAELDRSYLLWIWIPLITAGVLIGVFLDLGYRKHSR